MVATMVATRDKMNLFQYKLKFTLALEQCKYSFILFYKANFISGTALTSKPIMITH